MLSTLSFKNFIGSVGLERNLRSVVNTRKMCNWEIEKKKYLSMSLEDKRKHYTSRQFILLNSIPTWKQYAEELRLAEKLPPLKPTDINNSLNSVLVDKVSLFAGDITKLEIDVIVNAANKYLRGGGGVDEAIHRAADRNLLHQECSSIGGCSVGEVRLTGGYKLPAKYIIHTVGPMDGNTNHLIQCYRNSFNLMLEKSFRTIAFPCIATGIYHFPQHSASNIAVSEARNFLERHYDKVDRIIFCVFLPSDKYVYEQTMSSYFPID